MWLFQLISRSISALSLFHLLENPYCPPVKCVKGNARVFEYFLGTGLSVYPEPKGLCWPASFPPSCLITLAPSPCRVAITAGPCGHATAHACAHTVAKTGGGEKAFVSVHDKCTFGHTLPLLLIRPCIHLSLRVFVSGLLPGTAPPCERLGHISSLAAEGMAGLLAPPQPPANTPHKSWHPLDELEWPQSGKESNPVFLHCSQPP